MEAPRRSRAGKSRRLRGTSVALPPRALISSSASSSPPTVRATRITWAPASANASAAARPIPRDAPVTSATRPSSVFLAIVSGDVREERELVVLGAAADVGQLNRIGTREAGIAELRRRGIALAAAHGAVETVHRYEGERIRADGPAHRLDVHAMREQIVGVGRVDTVEAGVCGRRARDAEVHLRRAGIAHHLHDLLRGCAPDDR